MLGLTQSKSTKRFLIVEVKSQKVALVIRKDLVEYIDH